MKLHARTMIVAKANADLRTVCCDWLDCNDITYIEAIRCMLDVVTSWTKYPLRDERHPGEPDKRADEE